jgi:hypothetical protein
MCPLIATLSPFVPAPVPAQNKIDLVKEEHAREHHEQVGSPKDVMRRFCVLYVLCVCVCVCGWGLLFPFLSPNVRCPNRRPYLIRHPFTLPADQGIRRRHRCRFCAYHPDLSAAQV